MFGSHERPLSLTYRFEPNMKGGGMVIDYGHRLTIRNNNTYALGLGSERFLRCFKIPRAPLF